MLATLLLGLLDHVVEEPPRRLLQAVGTTVSFLAMTRNAVPSSIASALRTGPGMTICPREEMRVVNGVLIIPRCKFPTFGRCK